MKPVDSVTSKVVCVGRNYAEHAKELGNEVPSEPVIFMKPASALTPAARGVDWSRSTKQGQLGELHFECELCLQIGKPLSCATSEQALHAVSAYTLGLDMTLRDVQNRLKTKGLPWERAKAFDGSCVLGEWIECSKGQLPAEYLLKKNNQVVQHAVLEDMIFDPFWLVAHISEFVSLAPGDVIMTGTPKGVGPVVLGDQLCMSVGETHTLVDVV